MNPLVLILVVLALIACLELATHKTGKRKDAALKAAVAHSEQLAKRRRKAC